MINPNTKERELAYVVQIDKVNPIPGYDRVELAYVGGWTVVVEKDEFKAGDLAIYFEIDSKLPEVEPFTSMEFLVKKHYKVKTQKMCKSYSQGLLVYPEAFPNWFVYGKKTPETNDEWVTYIEDDKNKSWYIGDFLTEKLGVTYAVSEDNKRKGKSPDKYQKMAQRMGKKFSKQPYRWLMQREWGKKLLFLLFGNKRDKVQWPSWVVKTDEERVQNMTWVLEDKTPWYATEKIDGTSTTFTMKGFGRKRVFYICSRNVVFDKPDKKCYYDTNVYTEMAEKYNIEDVLSKILDDSKKILDFVTLQGETYGEGIQKRDYGLKEHNFMAFNLIFGFKDGTTSRLNPGEMTDLLKEIYNIPCVPIVSENFVLPDTVEELLAAAGGASAIDGGMREGLVFRSSDGARSFKAVSNEFLLKYHGN